MIIAAIAWVCLLQQAPANTVEYDFYEANLAFSHPKDWRIKVDKKAHSAHVTIPLGGKTRHADLDVFAVVFGSKTDLWQAVQLQINKQMGHEVVRQWQEEILDMPMLLTQTHYYENGHELKSLSAMIYMKWSKKMLLRLTADVDAYPDAEVELRQALQTLHTIDGSTAVAEIPDRPVTKEEEHETVTAGTEKVTFIQNPSLRMKIRKGQMAEAVTVGGKPAVFRFPKGWKSKQTTGGFELGTSGLRAPVEITVNSDLDSDPPADALQKAAAASLARFIVAPTRDEVTDKLMDSGSSVSWVWRVGTGTVGPICAWDAVGQIGDNYWQLSYAPDHVATKKEYALLADLISKMSVDEVETPAKKK